MPTADEDNFDIDIYGDGEGDGDVGNDGNMDYKQDDDELEFQVDVEEDIPRPDEAIVKPEPEKEQTSAPAATEPEVQKEVDQSAKSSAVPSKPVPQQGVKRKETSDERPIDPGATTALMISELHWWTTEDDIRGWINEAGAEEELKELTFSEHKVNGKSKGLVMRCTSYFTFLANATLQPGISRILLPSSSNRDETQTRLVNWQPAQFPQAHSHLHQRNAKSFQDPPERRSNTGQRRADCQRGQFQLRTAWRL